MPKLVAAAILFVGAVATRNTGRGVFFDSVSRICAFGCGIGLSAWLLHL